MEYRPQTQKIQTATSLLLFFEVGGVVHAWAVPLRSWAYSCARGYFLPSRVQLDGLNRENETAHSLQKLEPVYVAQ